MAALALIYSSASVSFGLLKISLELSLNSSSYAIKRAFG